MNKVFLSPTLQSLKGKSVLDNFFWKWSSRRAEKDATKQKVLSFQEIGQNRKIVIKSEFTPLSLSRLQNVFLELGSVASIKLIYPDVSVANQIINT